MPIKMPCKLCKNALGYGLFRGGNFRQDVWFSILQTMRCLEVELVDFKINICCKRLHFLNQTIVFVYCPIKEKIPLLTGSRDFYFLQIQLFFLHENLLLSFDVHVYAKKSGGQVFDIFMTWLFNKWQKPTNIFIKCFFFPHPIPYMCMSKRLKLYI